MPCCNEACLARSRCRNAVGDDLALPSLGRRALSRPEGAMALDRRSGAVCPRTGAPLIPEYQAIFEANVKDQASGGQGTTPTYKCLSPGMPRVTNGYGEMEFIITPDTTYILVDHILDDRRIFTDGRDWPKEWSRPSSAIRSENGSIPRTPATMTCSRSKPAASRARARSMRAAFRCTRTTRPSFRNGSISTPPTATWRMTRSR